MAEPTSSDVHVNQLLTMASIGYKNNNYIAPDLAPDLPVTKQTGIVPKYNQSYWFRDAAGLRAPGTKSVRGGFTVDNSTLYHCHRYSYGFEIPDEYRDNTDAPYDLDRDGAMYATDKVMLRRELDFATNFFTTSVFSTDKTGGTDFSVWSDYASSTPLVDITEYMDDVEGLIAVAPNVMAMGKQVWSKLKWHPDIIDTIKHTQTAMMTVDLFAALIEVEKVRVGRGIYTTSVEGTAEASVSYSRIWGKHALLMNVPNSPSLFAPSAMYRVVWNRVPNASQYIKQLRDEDAEVDTVEANSYFQHLVTSANSGVFLSGAVA